MLKSLWHWYAGGARTKPESMDIEGRREIPFDIIVEIIKLADRTTIHNMSLLNSSCNDACNKYIWEKIVVFKNRQKLDHDVVRLAADIIRRAPIRGRWIRELTIFSSQFSRTGLSDLDWNVLSPLIIDILRHTTRLHTLTVELDDTIVPCFSPNLDQVRLPLLQNLKIHPRCYHFFETFLFAHPTIECLSMVNDTQRPWLDSFLSFRKRREHEPLLLPNLMRVSGLQSTIIPLLEGRDVTHMRLYLSDIRLLESIIETNPTLVHTLQSLHISFDEHSFLLKPALLEIVKFTNLEELSMSADDWSYDESAKDHRDIISLLGSLPSVTSIDWSGSYFPDFAFSPEVYACETLNSVRLLCLDFIDRFDVVLRRVSEWSRD